MLWCVLDSVNFTHYLTVYMCWNMTEDATAKETDRLMDAILTIDLETFNIQTDNLKELKKQNLHYISMPGCTYSAMT